LTLEKQQALEGVLPHNGGMGPMNTPPVPPRRMMSFGAAHDPESARAGSSVAMSPRAQSTDYNGYNNNNNNNNNGHNHATTSTPFVDSNNNGYGNDLAVSQQQSHGRQMNGNFNAGQIWHNNDHHRVTSSNGQVQPPGSGHGGNHSGSFQARPLWAAGSNNHSSTVAAVSYEDAPSSDHHSTNSNNHSSFNGNNNNGMVHAHGNSNGNNGSGHGRTPSAIARGSAIRNGSSGGSRATANVINLPTTAIMNDNATNHQHTSLPGTPAMNMNGDTTPTHNDDNNMATASPTAASILPSSTSRDVLIDQPSSDDPSISTPSAANAPIPSPVSNGSTT
jgi:hypothetical protein